MKDHVAVLVPCYNESKTIEKVVRDFKRVLPEATVYVYDNNSSDGTGEIAARAGAVVRRERMQGKGSVIRRMFREIDADCYLMVDGDDTYPAEDAPAMVSAVLDEQADMVVGDRLSSTYFTENKRPFHNLGNGLVRASINHLFGSDIKNVMIVIGVTTWSSNAKLMRAQALSLRERTFVKSAIALGETKMQVLFKYILPNGIFPVVANTTRGMAGAILTEASLSFLGLGDPNTISWGQMIYQGKSYVTSAWWITGFAGIAIILTVIVFYLLGDGLNHVLNPKYSQGGKH